MQIKRTILALAIAFLSAAAAEAGAPPSVSFIPDKTWCKKMGYGKNVERRDKMVFTEDVLLAFENNSDLKNVTVELNKLFSDNFGINAKDITSSSEADDEEELEMELYEGEEGGTAELTAYEQAIQKLRPDILIKIGWDKNPVGFNYTLTYRMEAIDTYSNKSIASVLAHSAVMNSSVTINQTITKLTNDNMSEFANKMQEHFDDIQANGREIKVTLNVKNTSTTNMNSEIDGKDLSVIIKEYVHDNSIGHQYSERSATRNRIQYEQVRIPVKSNAKEFMDGLSAHLKKYGIKCENITKGLGDGRLALTD